MSQRTRKFGMRQGAAPDVPLVAALAAAPLFLIASVVPPQAVLPSVSLCAFGAAAVAAVAAWLTGADRSGSRLSFRDVAGALVLIGAAAGAFSDPRQVQQFFGAAMAAP